MPLIVHFKKPSDWRNTINIHYWDTNPAIPQTTWPGIAMTAEGDDWFVHRFETAETASIVFNDGAGRQSGNLRRDQEGWYYRNNNWYDANPERPQIPVVTVSPPAQVYLTAQQVVLQGSNRNDVIYYTTDGTPPTTASPVYAGPITIAQPTTLMAFGVNSAGDVGGISTFVYTIDPNADLERPTIAASVANGAYENPVNVVFTLRDNRPAPVVAYYTTDGSTPTPTSPVYARGDATAGLVGNPIAVTSSATIRFLAIDGAGNETRQSFYYNIGPVSAPTDFREETIYFLITTRFYDGDPANNYFCRDRIKFNAATGQAEDPHWRGDFRGLIQQLDYLRDLGFTAIWITPPVENRSGLDYHGYHAYDWTRIDPRLESPGATYQDLINAAHARRIKIIQDVVVNHSSQYGIRGQVWIDHLPIKYYVPRGSQQGRINNGPYQGNLGDYRSPNREDNDNPLAPAWFRERLTSDPAGSVPLVDPRTSATVPSPGYDPNRFFGVDANTLDPEWFHQQGFMAGGDWGSLVFPGIHNPLIYNDI